ncbi:hypothetical protein KZP23_07330 [Echinicola marina]|uniref:S41 family peptidase n=1 Tax=Echinicola marina TaxID=2859768 RepID=UPI001CF71448|nr:S41 family peptidase [Echinicola marina]UCS94812.1 hypothetical protein KZP23_07330 [Echinicola marina]
MKNTLALIFFISFLGCQGQVHEKFNLGFENTNNTDQLSEGWFKWGNYDLAMDSTQVHSGLSAGKISSNEKGNFGSIAYRIPAEYTGKSIKLEGYMKIKNVKNGHAGLLLRIDHKGQSLEFDNMQKQQISGTEDWKKYSISLNYPESADNIYVGGILTGKGEAWFDDFKLTIDGNNVQTLKVIEKIAPKAESDNKFDKGSAIEIANLSPEKVDNLTLLGRVWGFLKYHHPEIAKGNFNWDYELFRFLPDYISSSNELERDQLLVGWMNSIGKISPCNDCRNPNEKAFLKPDLNWIESQSPVLKKNLLYIYQNTSNKKHYYIEMAPGVGNPKFTNEDPYLQFDYPDDGFRLLALYRYWNMINYFFPYKYLTDKDWNEVLKEYIPIFLKANNELEYELACLQVIAEIHDTHGFLSGKADKFMHWRGENYPPFHLRFIEDQLVVTDYYNPELKSIAGLKIGDVITKVDGKSIEEIIKQNSKYNPASNYTTQLRNISADILRSNLPEVEIHYISDDSKEQSKKIKLYPKDSLNIYRFIQKSSSKSFKMLDDNIGYITLQTIKNEDIPQLKEAFMDTKGIIIDIRNYPSTFVPFSLGSFFVSSPTAFVKLTGGSVENPGEFSLSKNLKIHKQGKTYKGMVVVMVNELSVSQAEYTAMAFRAGNNTTIIGSTTAGADGNVSPIQLPGGLRTMISGIGVYYPNGEETQRVGIIPDIEVKPTIKGIKEGRDELLEKAIEIIMEE